MLTFFRRFFQSKIGLPIFLGFLVLMALAFAAARIGWTASGDLPIQSLYQLGGPFRLSGLDSNALSGQYLGFGRLTYFRRVNDFQLMPAYLGGSLEAGNAWLDSDDVGLGDLRYGGNLFFGVDTPIGPLYLGGVSLVVAVYVIALRKRMQPAGAPVSGAAGR